MRRAATQTLSHREIRGIKRLLAVSGPIDERRGQQYGIGSRIYMDVIEQALRWAACDPSSPTHKEGLVRLHTIELARTALLRHLYSPEEARARAACGLSYAWRYAHAKPLPQRNHLYEIA
ncbi:MAG: hypothetical protein RLZZ444_1081 [Pseudomonadota bacterium]|jgi:hypothetical protein